MKIIMKKLKDYFKLITLKKIYYAWDIFQKNLFQISKMKIC